MKIDFYLRFRTYMGQSISITGNLGILGHNEKDGALPMNFLTEDYWHVSIELDEFFKDDIQYHYLFKNEHGDISIDAEKKDRIIKVNGKSIIVIDSWNSGGDYASVFSTTPFRNVFSKESKQLKLKTEEFYTHIFKVKAPLIKDNECLCLLGNATELDNWQTEKPVLLQKENNWWVTRVNLSGAQFPLAYKYGIYNLKKQEFVSYEEGDNRILYFNQSPELENIVHDGFVRINYTQWKAAGVAIPVFSLRSKESFGIGEFTDIRLLADWASETGLKLIQLLPINDTIATYTWKDSYPYAAISAFALHPVYINLQKVAGKKHASIIKALAKKRKQLNDLTKIDFESVLQFKIKALREIYELEGTSFLKEEGFQVFFHTNKYWLKPYAAFCLLRDKFGTSEFSKWKNYSVYNAEEIDRLCSHKSKQYKNIAFWYFVQYHLHVQLKNSVKHAHKKGVALKGDIPIGIYRYGCDAWVNLHLFNMDQQAGAPPDDFAVKGQNWGFPTYNWQKMQEDHFEWWRNRFEQMSHYFDAFRIDHILGFFRIWSIPYESVEGIMGRFIPAIPISVQEFGEQSIWFDQERLCKPYITDEIIAQQFGEHADFARDSFFFKNEKGVYELKEEFNTQRKVENYFSLQDASEDNQQIKEALFNIISNVILFEEPGSEKEGFHFRISMEQTTSYQALDDHLKRKLWDLYIHYFYYRHDSFWEKEAIKKLPALKEATDMMVCGEDLGMVPASVPGVMRSLGILSLDVQRMPKNAQTEFFRPQNATYLSVITPSTHDMSTIRAWWEEEPVKTQRFFNSVLGEQSDAPAHCEPWINRAIVMQHLYSPAMWSIFQFQDILGMSEKLRRINPEEERINVPAIANHYWNYRMHLTLEDLLKEKEFNHQLRELIKNSGREQA
jgi:4-alpha-glucanotransferase